MFTQLETITCACPTDALDMGVLGVKLEGGTTPRGLSTEETATRRRVARGVEWLVHGREVHNEGDQCVGMLAWVQEAPTLPHEA